MGRHYCHSTGLSMLNHRSRDVTLQKSGQRATQSPSESGGLTRQSKLFVGIRLERACKACSAAGRGERGRCCLVRHTFLRVQ